MPALDDRKSAQFRAVAGMTEGFGVTPREALDALMSRLPPNGPPLPLVIWPFNTGDAFFTDAQQTRLRDLKDRTDTLTADERAELENLVEAAFDATVARSKSLRQFKPQASNPSRSTPGAVVKSARRDHTWHSRASKSD